MAPRATEEVKLDLVQKLLEELKKPVHNASRESAATAVLARCAAHGHWAARSTASDTHATRDVRPGTRRIRGRHHVAHGAWHTRGMTRWCPA